MRIYDINVAGPAAGEAGRTQEAQRSGTANGAKSSAAGSSAGDHIDLSTTLNSVSRALSAYSSGRAAKIEALTAQYNSGAYRPNSLAIGRGMVAEALTREGG